MPVPRLLSTLAVGTALPVALGLLPAAAASPFTALPASAAEQRAPGAPYEVLERRTRSSSTVVDPATGDMTTSLSAGAVHFRDGGGSWKRIDSTLVETTERGYAYRNAANGFTALFKGESGPEHLRFDDGARAYSLTLEGAAARRPAKAKAARLGYADVVGGTDLVYDVLADGIKETLLLEDAKAATRYRFRLTPEGDAPLTAQDRGDGSWAFTSGARMSPSFVLERPVALDAPAAPGLAPTPDTGSATMDVRPVGKAYDITLEVDRDWLRAPERRFPVELDPTITLTSDVEDASFATPCANCTPFVNDKIYVGTDTNYAWRGALTFDLAEIPEAADVTDATLQTYWAPLCLSVGTGFCNGTSHQTDLHAMTGPWSTTSTTSQVAYSPTVLGSATVSGVDAQASWVSWPVTGLLRDWLSSTSTNFGVLLKRSTEPLGASGPVFYGRRAGEPSLQPKLVVTYPGDAVNLLVPETLHSDGADLRWTPYPTTAVTPFSSYEVHRSSDPTFVPSAATLLTTIRDRTVTTFRDQRAAAGRSFTYKVVTGAVPSTGRTVTLPALGQATKALQPSAAAGDATSVVYANNLVNCAGYGAEPKLFVGPAATTTSRALLRFDVRDVPATAVVTRAVVSAWHPSRVDTTQTVRAYAATAEWREGTALSTCTRDSATWYDAYGGVPWTAPGGDTEATAVASVTNAPGDLPAFDDFDVTALAQSWVRGTVPNHGVLLRQDVEAPGTGSLLNYHSDDFGVAPSLRPKLVVTYTDGSAPQGPTVDVSAPLAGAVVSGSAVKLTATASDDRRVDRIELLVDGTVVGSSTSSETASITWNSTTVATGPHTVTARATDDAGNVTTSPAVAVTVDNSALPTTSMTSPTGSGVTSYRDAVLADKPLGYWRLGESVGAVDVLDSSGAGRHGRHEGTPTVGVTGAVQRDPDLALQVNAGSDDWVSVVSDPAWDLGDSFTMEWWGQSLGTQTSTYPGFLRRGAAGTVGDGWLVWWSPTTGTLSYKRDGREYTTNAGAVTTGFRHYAVAYDEAAQTLQWYVDGVADRLHTGVVFSAPNGNAHRLRLGRGDEYASARLDEVALYPTALPAARVSAHRSAGVSAPATVTGTVPVTATAGDDRGVTRVEFLADDVRFAEDTVAPYEASWNTLDPALPAPDGVHVLTTKAYDAAGQVRTSTAVPVRVANTTGTRYRAATGSSEVPEIVVADPAQTSALDVRVTNDATTTWPGASTAVRYAWVSKDAAPVTTTGTAVALGTDVPPGQSKKVRVDVVPPTLPDGTDRAAYSLKVDVVDTATGTSYAAKGNRPQENDVQVVKALEDTLGLERWRQYRGTELGAGVGGLVDVATGNNIWRWTPSSSPGRGLSTVVDLTYNSLEKAGPSPVGPGVNLSISSLTRFGLPIDIHPNKADTVGGKSNRYVVFTDGDGTTHRFTGTQAADGTVVWDAPPGVHLYLRATGSTDPARTWAFSRPDRVTYYFDADGYPTLVEDANGNKITYTLEAIPPGEDGGPVKKRITRVTDAGGRSYVLDYFSKAEVKKAQVRGRLQRLTDHTGSAWDFGYYDDGNLRTITQVGGVTAAGGPLPDRRVVLTYTTSNGAGPAIADPALRADPDPKTPNQSTLVYSVRDPRGAETRYAYYGPGSAQLRDRVQSVTDRAGATTSYTYDLTARTTTVAAPLSRTTVYTWDTLGRATAVRDALGQTTTMTWNDDNKVVRLAAPGGGVQTYAYNANGYQASTTDENGHTTLLEFEDVAADGNDVSGKWEPGRTIPHFSQLKHKTSPRGTASATVGDYRWAFAYDSRGNLLTTTDPTGAVTTLVVNADGTVASERSPRGGTTTFAYDANGLATSVTDPVGRKTQYNYDADGLLRWTQDARHTGATGANPREYRTYLDYDSFHRMGRQSSPKSTDAARGTLIWSGADFDANDNVVKDVNGHFGTQYAPALGFQVDRAYDAMDRQTLQTARDTSADPAGERTTSAYDAAGRLVRQVQPKGVQTPAVANDHATENAYDLLDRVTRETRYEVDGAGVLRSTQHTHRCYSTAGDLVKQVAPGANRATISCADTTVPYATVHAYDAGHRLLSTTDPAGRVTRFAYDADDNRTSVTDVAGAVTTTDYDPRDLPVKTVQPFATGRTLTTLLEYDANGNRSRVITPRAYDASADKVTFTKYVTRYVYDLADQQTRVDLPSAGVAGDQHYKHMAYDGVGNLQTVTQEVSQSTLATVPMDRREDRTYWDLPGAVRTSDDHVNPPLHYDVDAMARQVSRTPQVKGSGELNTAERQTWAYYVDGKLRERGDSGGQKVTYTYDANNVTRTVKDSSGVGASRQRTMTLESYPDGLDRVARTRQRKEGETRWRATLFTFDLQGNTTRRVDDREEDDAGTQLKAGRVSDFTFDGSDRMTTQVDQGKDLAASTADDVRTRTTYVPQGWEASRTTEKWVPASASWQVKQTQDWTWYAGGQLRTTTTKNAAGTVLESHDVAYVEPSSGQYLNGNQATDTYRRSSPSTATPCSSATCTARFTYDARDRLTQRADGGGTTSYVLDPAGNITSETEGGVTTGFTYKGNQLDTVTAGGTVVSRSHYDSRGNLDCTTGAGGTGADCRTGTGVQTDYTYDHLDRMTAYKDSLGGSDASYEYDALDRQTRQRETHSGSAPRVTELSHLGLTDAVTKEEHRSDAGALTRTKTYSYDVNGSATGMSDQSAGGAEKQYSYGKDTLGSVSQLIDETGKASASYGYKPYGESDSGTSAGDTDAKNPVNPIRFTENRFDSGSGTLQMGVRRFGPSHRFLQEDRYADALSDLNLSTDPLTSNRFSLAGGNPANFVEYDGHFSLSGLFGDAKDAVKKGARKTKRFFKQQVKPRVEEGAKKLAKDGAIGVATGLAERAVSKATDGKVARGARDLVRRGADAVEDAGEDGAKAVSKYAGRLGGAGKKVGKAVAKWGDEVPDKLEDGIRGLGSRINGKTFGKGFSKAAGAVGTALGAVGGYQQQQKADEGSGRDPGDKFRRGLFRGGVEAVAGAVGGAVGAAVCAPGLLAAAACGAAGGMIGGEVGDIAADAVLGKDGDGILSK